MKPQNKSILLFLFITIIFQKREAMSQTASSKFIIYGKAADSVTKKPMDKITVNLISPGVRTKNALTKSDGSFEFIGLSSLTYSIEITSVDYHTKTITVRNEGNNINAVDLGVIYIRNKVNTLNDVVVTAKTPLIKQEIDKITYDLQADPESKGNSVLEMMRKVPFLSVDGDNNILLKGSSSYKILINGKPSGMIERNPKDILRSMPASTIKSIEVITNPSSKYDAEGLAGIINIITNKKVDNGYNGTINVNHRFPVGGPGAGGSFAFKHNKFGISALGGASIYNSPEVRNLTNRITTGINATNLAQNSTRESDGRNVYLGSELSFEPDSLNLISAQFNINGSRSNGFSNQSTILKAESQLLQKYDLINSNEGNGNGLDLALNYQLGFKSGKERLLTFSYRYLGYNNDQFNSLDVSNPVNYTNPDYHQANEGRSSEQTFQVDYVHPLKKLNIEAGIKGILRTNKSHFQYSSFDSANGKFELDPSRTDNFNNDQNVFSAYNTYQYNLNNWAFKAGLRIEQTVISGDFISGGWQLKQNYLSVIPSATISRKFTDMSSLNLAYTKRIQRPGIYQLNPFVDRSNPNFETTGNPNLKPAYTNVIQLGYNKSKKATINISLGYMHFNNLIGPVSVYDPATNITRTTFSNAGKARIFKTNFYFNYPITKSWNARLNSDIRYVASDVMVKGVLVKNEALMAYVNVTTGYKFEKGWRINADLTVNSGGVTSVQARSNGFTSTSFSVQKDLKDKVTFSASFTNPFNTFRRSIEETLGADFTQIVENRIYFRSFNVSLNYRFGKLKDAVKKNKRGINNDDVSN
jgi:outer membrane receptor protein involved in Fe transport